ncbi:MAG TPA: IPT/TIG domain-containing protein [Pyrinomonadaceae bacterium]|nr:IPT/TIG domain-containing protein [Pyrinomonadaceae bacterium]
MSRLFNQRVSQTVALSLLLLLASGVSSPFTRTGLAQTGDAVKHFHPDARGALARRNQADGPSRRDGSYTSTRARKSSALQSRASASRMTSQSNDASRIGSHAAARRDAQASAQSLSPARPPSPPRARRASAETLPSVSLPRVRAGTPLSRVLHTSQLSLINSGGTNEQFADQTGDLAADERTTFDTAGGSYDIAVGRSGSRYEVFSAVDTRGTTTTGDDRDTGVLVVGEDRNNDFVRDPGGAQTFDLELDFRLPSAVSVVAGTSASGREFVVVSSSGYFNTENPNDPNNEPSPGVVLLVRDFSTGGFDRARSRELVSVGDDRLFNANALALLPRGDLLVADFQSNEIRVIRDTDGDRVPDTLGATPFHTFPFSADAEDAPLDIAANSRGIVFSHSVGASSNMLAIFDTDADGFADTDEIVVEGLSIDNNLVLHGLAVARDGTVYVVEDALGEHDRPADGGNGGVPRVITFPDPALNAVLRDGSVFAEADDEFTQALTGLAFGVDTQLGPVGRLTMTNSASLRGDATSDGLATIMGANLTRGASGATAEDASARNLRVTIEGHVATVLSFDDTRIHVHVPASLGVGIGSVVVTVGGAVTAADDARVVLSNPGLFTVAQDGAGEAIALLVSGERYTRAPFPARVNGQPSVVALFGTGWRNSGPVNVTVGGRAATVQYAGASLFPGLDQLNVALPEGTSGNVAVVVTTAQGATSRGDALITVQ